MTLDQLVTPERLSETDFELQIPDGWQQGRGAFGGLVLAGLVRCVEIAEPDAERRVRSITAEFAGPVPVGPARVRIEALRRGNAVSTVRASVVQGDEVLTDMVAVLGRARPDTPSWSTVTAPALPDWREVPVAPIEPPIAPVFAPHFEYRVTGDLPFFGGNEAAASGWIRPKNPGSARGAAYVTACADAWWPSGCARFDGIRPIATVAFTLQFVSPLDGLDLDAPMFHRAHTPVSADGYMVETRELWGEDGRLVAVNHQTVAIIK